MCSVSTLYKGTHQSLEIMAAGALAECLENAVESGIDYTLTDSDLRLAVKALRLLANVEAAI